MPGTAASVPANQGVRTTGVCVKCIYRERGIRLVVRFHTRSGATRRFLGPSSPVAVARVGEQVDVIYDPRNPENAGAPPVAPHSCCCPSAGS
ncbi:DUF3592 domain-containing protein [Streptomyces nitrosporeus]|uniref:DUF3592 domain-containing protein n=1 Tax=Streptomyces nitrosporeus TaxID=28894 RepID=UPI003570EE21